MRNPPHPGEVLKDGVLSDGVTVTAFAKRLGVSRVMLSNIVNGHAAISAWHGASARRCTRHISRGLAADAGSARLVASAEEAPPEDRAAQAGGTSCLGMAPIMGPY
jgi:hypothetical protein